MSWKDNPDWKRYAVGIEVTDDMLEKRKAFKAAGGSMIKPWRYGDRIRISTPRFKSGLKVGSQGHIVEFYTQGGPQVQWDNGTRDFWRDEYLEFVHPIRICPGCEEPTFEPDFADYLCKKCR